MLEEDNQRGGDFVTDITIERDGYKTFFKMGNEKIEITDYQIKSSADGTAELVVAIKGIPNIFEMSANLKVKTQ